MYASDCKANKVDILRLSKYYGYFLRKNKYLTDFEEYKKRAKAPLEHLFNCHDFCSTEWCPVKKHPDKDYNHKYRCKKKNHILYEQLKEIFDTFNTDEKLKQMFHPFDTQKNEGLNTAVLYGAPKHKNYSTTMSLASRVATRSALNSVGYVKFFGEVFEELGIDPGRNTLKSWESVDKEMECHRLYLAKTTTKSNRVKKQNEEIKRSYREDQADQKKGITYKSGIAFDNTTTHASTKRKKVTKSVLIVV